MTEHRPLTSEEVDDLDCAAPVMREEADRLIADWRVQRAALEEIYSEDCFQDQNNPGELACCLISKFPRSEWCKPCIARNALYHKPTKSGNRVGGARRDYGDKPYLGRDPSGIGLTTLCPNCHGPLVYYHAQGMLVCEPCSKGHLKTPTETGKLLRDVMDELEPLQEPQTPTLPRPEPDQDSE